jgi:hypothetical protein
MRYAVSLRRSGAHAFALVSWIPDLRRIAAPLRVARCTASGKRTAFNLASARQVLFCD